LHVKINFLSVALRQIKLLRQKRLLRQYVRPDLRASQVSSVVQSMLAISSVTILSSRVIEVSPSTSEVNFFILLSKQRSVRRQHKGKEFGALAERGISVIGTRTQNTLFILHVSVKCCDVYLFHCN